MNTKQKGKTQAHVEKRKALENQPTRWQKSQKEYKEKFYKNSAAVL